MSALIVAVLAAAILLGSLIVVLVIGLHVTKTYPDLGDERRGWRRYTIPAAIATLTAFFALCVTIVALGIALTG